MIKNDQLDEIKELFLKLSGNEKTYQYITKQR